MAVRHRDSDYFKASQVPMHAQPSSDPVKRWRRSKRRPRFRREDGTMGRLDLNVVEDHR